MIRINLLPPEIYAAEFRKQFQILGIIVGSFTLFVFIGFLVYRFTVANKLQKDLDQARQELAKYQDIVDKVHRLEETKNQLVARRDVIQRLLKGRLIYPKFFEDFMALLPSEVWVSNLNTTSNSAQPGSLGVSVSAQSTSNFAIADWVTNLQASPFCSGVELGAVSATESAEGRAPMLSFTITFQYLRGDA